MRIIEFMTESLSTICIRLKAEEVVLKAVYDADSKQIIYYLSVKWEDWKFERCWASLNLKKVYDHDGLVNEFMEIAKVSYDERS